MMREDWIAEMDQAAEEFCSAHAAEVLRFCHREYRVILRELLRKAFLAGAVKALEGLRR